MIYSTDTSSWDDAVRMRVMLLAQNGGEVDALPDEVKATIAHQVERLLATYVALTRTLRFPPTPDMLRSLGSPGRELHRLFCVKGRSGLWKAFRTVVAHEQSDLPCDTPTWGG